MHAAARHETRVQVLDLHRRQLDGRRIVHAQPVRSAMMQFVIEYLREPTDEYSVCHSVALDSACLNDAGVAAFTGAPALHASHGANGFQIRDDAGKIVALEAL